MACTDSPDVLETQQERSITRIKPLLPSRIHAILLNAVPTRIQYPRERTTDRGIFCGEKPRTPRLLCHCKDYNQASVNHVPCLENSQIELQHRTKSASNSNPGNRSVLLPRITLIKTRKTTIAENIIE